MHSRQVGIPLRRLNQGDIRKIIVKTVLPDTFCIQYKATKCVSLPAVTAAYQLCSLLIVSPNLLVCCCSVAKSCPTLYDPWTAACQTSLSFALSQSMLKFMSIESVMLSNHLILSSPLLLLFSVFLNIGVFFSNELALCIKWPIVVALASASVLPMNIQS